MIYYTTMLHDELDFLKLQLMLNYDKVDRFIISESAYTFSGKPKPLFYQKHRCRFEQYWEKILYFEVDLTRDLPLISKLDPKENMDAWRREKKQREHIFQSLDLQPEDIIFMVDMDEVTEVDVVLNKMDINRLNYMMLNFHMYYMNVLKTPEPHMTGPCVFTYECYKRWETILKPWFNMRRFIDVTKDYFQVYDCGYHFERCYDLKTKLESFSHTDRNTEQTLLDWCEERRTLMNGQLVPVEIPEFFTKNVDPKFLYRTKKTS